MALTGWATTEGTAAYRERFQGRIPGDHYTLLRDPCIKALAHGLRGRLNRAEISFAGAGPV